MDITRRVTAVPAGSGPAGRRADAGAVRLTGRDVAGLLLAGDMYGTPYDLLASFLGWRPRGCAGLWRGGAAPGTRRPRGWGRGRRGAG